MKSREKKQLPRISLRELSWEKHLCCGADNSRANSHWHLGPTDSLQFMLTRKRSSPLNFWHCSSRAPAGAIGSFGSVLWKKKIGERG